jgi:hypothetical protein
VRLNRRYPTAVEKAVLDQRSHHLADRTWIDFGGCRQVDARL